MEHIKSQSEGHSVEHGHEQSDVNIKLIVAFGAFLFLCGIAVHATLWGMYQGLDKWKERNDPAPNPMLEATRQQQGSPAEPHEPMSQSAESTQDTLKRIVTTFPEPRLQPDEARDLHNFLRREDEVMSEYAYIDKNSGIVRIPVERAMQLLAQRGLPHVAPGPVKAAPVIAAPGNAAPGSVAPGNAVNVRRPGAVKKPPAKAKPSSRAVKPAVTPAVKR